MFFNGFALKNENLLLNDYLYFTNFSVNGFSKGAQDAFEYTLKYKNRIDTLNLISPAFFQDRSLTFKEKQIHIFNKNRKGYLKQFSKNMIFNNKKISLISFIDYHNKLEEDLRYLLEYVWDEEKILFLLKKNINIKVFIGDKDKIVNPKKSFDFFSKLTNTYLIKNRGHILK